MEIMNLGKNSKELDRMYQLYMRCIQRKEMLHERMEKARFAEILFSREKEVKTMCFSDTAENAFAAGCIDSRVGRAFITMILVDPDHRRQGLGRQMLQVLERELQRESDYKNMEISFLNPCAFSWEIPNKDGVVHANTPGVNLKSDAYLFFQNCGYRMFALQNSYFMDLKEFEMLERIAFKKEQLRKEGITFEIYDDEKHSYMNEMIKQFGSSVWEREICGEPSVHKGGRPIICPVFENQACGFAGPLDVEKNGRGYFAGIAVDEKFQGKGIAKVLFNCLCCSLKEIGADYMTLFTGENNHARNIYEAAGFKITASWADMRKRL